MIVVFAVLLPATVSAFHALAKLCRRPTHSRAASDRIGNVVEPIPASA
jgi:hypothetical protein